MPRKFETLPQADLDLIEEASTLALGAGLLTQVLKLPCGLHCVFETGEGFKKLAVYLDGTAWPNPKDIRALLLPFGFSTNDFDEFDVRHDTSRQALVVTEGEEA